ncbi:MAG TPA: hypothetical protein VNN79_21675, partial [Actinomycetota bacterium]|nr:hypothetical protein [Actinomycetota bacterium]
AGAKKAAIKVAVPQTADAMGNRTDTGATAVMSAGLDLAAVNKAGASVDFSAGRPLAAMVAAALDLPLNVILAESDQGEAADLDVPTVKAMQFRQQQWSEGLVRMFAYLGARTAKIVFPPIQAAPLHRVIQAIVTAASAGVLFPSEVRDLIVKALRSYGIDPRAGLPDPGEWKAYASPQAANPGTPPQQTPNDTATGPPDQRTAGGALADGDHEMRKSQGST